MLNLMQKLSTALRGGAREVLETTVDANAIRIFAQEIHECEASVQQAKKHLAGIMAEKLKLRRQIKQHEVNLTQREQTIRNTLAQEDETTALQLAEEMAQQETLLSTLNQQHEKLASYEQRLMQNLTETTHRLEQHRAELRMAQATQHAQQATGKLSSQVNDYSDQFSQMQDSLHRIRQQQDDFGDRMQAMDEIDARLNGEPAPGQEKRRQAEEILARLKIE